MRRNIIGSIVILVILVGIVAVMTFTGPAYDYDTDYAFQYSVKNVADTSDGRTVDGRLFIFDDGTTCSAPVTSEGRPILVVDVTLPVNTFRIVKRTVPPLTIGKQTFDPGGEYDEVRFNMANTESQA